MKLSPIDQVNGHFYSWYICLSGSAHGKMVVSGCLKSQGDLFVRGTLDRTDGRRC